MEKMILLSNYQFEEKINDMTKELRILLDSSRYKINELTSTKNNHNSPGIYLIRKPDNSEPIYIGITKKISQRMRDHLSTNGGRDLNVMIKNHPELPQDKTNYIVQYLEVTEARRRYLLENFFVSLMNPYLNGKDRN